MPQPLAREVLVARLYDAHSWALLHLRRRHQGRQFWHYLQFHIG
jgi:hypothetical protein